MTTAEDSCRVELPTTTNGRRDGGTAWTIVDAADLQILHDGKTWKIGALRRSSPRYVYAETTGRPKTAYLHRLILAAPFGTSVDHRNGDGTDNRRCNLRFATAAQNLANKRPQGAASRFKGVALSSCVNKPWLAKIQVEKKQRYLGVYETEEAAARAYDKAAWAAWGEFARLNFPLEAE